MGDGMTDTGPRAAVAPRRLEVDTPDHGQVWPREIVFALAGVSVYYGSFCAVRDVGFEIARHEITEIGRAHV